MLRTLLQTARDLELPAGDCLMFNTELDHRETLPVAEFWHRHAAGREGFPSRCSVDRMLRSRAWLGVVHGSGAVLVGL